MPSSGRRRRSDYRDGERKPDARKAISDEPTMPIDAHLVHPFVPFSRGGSKLFGTKMIPKSRGMLYDTMNAVETWHAEASPRGRRGPKKTGFELSTSQRGRTPADWIERSSRPAWSSDRRIEQPPEKSGSWIGSPRGAAISSTTRRRAKPGRNGDRARRTHERPLPLELERPPHPHANSSTSTRRPNRVPTLPSAEEDGRRGRS
jgi:hypothetical protein